MLAGYYATMSGVLAGFAFTAVVVLLSPTQIGERKISKDRARGDGVLPVLTAAFIVLILSTLTWSVLASQTAGEEHGRAATLELVDGIVFGLAVIMLFNGVTLLLLAGDINQVAVLTMRVVTVSLTPTLTLLFLTNGAAETEGVRATNILNRCTLAPAPALGLALTVAIAITLTLSLIPRLQPPIVRFWVKKLQSGVPIVVLAASVACIVASDELGMEPPDFLFSSAALKWYFACVFTLLLLLGLVISFGHLDS